MAVSALSLRLLVDKKPRRSALSVSFADFGCLILSRVLGTEWQSAGDSALKTCGCFSALTPKAWCVLSASVKSTIKTSVVDSALSFLKWHFCGSSEGPPPHLPSSPRWRRRRSPYTLAQLFQGSKGSRKPPPTPSGHRVMPLPTLATLNR